MKKKNLKEDIKKYQDTMISQKEEILFLKEVVEKLHTDDKLIGSDVAFRNYKIELFNKMNKELGIE